MKPLTLQEVEYFAHNIARRLMNFDEPLPPFESRYVGVLESCLSQPFQAYGEEDFYPALVDKATILFYLITKNHPFENGNKRMAVSTTLLFLYLNDHWLSMEPEVMYKIALFVAKSEPAEKDEVVAELKEIFSKYITTK